MMGALVDVFDAELALLYGEVAAYGDLFAHHRAPVRWLPSLAHRLGWQLDRENPESLRRKVVGLLVPLWRAKGTAPGVAAAVRLFVGLDVRVEALWADGWRLGRSHLGGRRYLYTAVGGEVEVRPGGLRYLPRSGTLRVWRNGVELGREQFIDDDRSVLMLTRGIVYRAAGGETLITLPFSYTPRPSGTDTLASLLQVSLNGTPLGGTGWTEPSNTTIDLSGALAAGDEVLIRSREIPSALSAGDEVLFVATRDDSTIVAPDTDLDVTTGADAATTLAARERAVTLVLRFPRDIDSTERALALWAAGIVKPSKARLLIPGAAPGGTRAPWRLGSSALGRGTLVARG